MSAETSSSKISEVVGVLQSVFTVTVELRKVCQAGDLAKTGELLKERETLLNRAAEIRKALETAPAEAQVKAQLQAHVAPLLQSIEKENELFLNALVEKRKLALEGLRQIQNQKSILAYIR
jgi:hypothetical protein